MLSKKGKKAQIPEDFEDDFSEEEDSEEDSEEEEEETSHKKEKKKKNINIEEVFAEIFERIKRLEHHNRIDFY